jgi:hypothetical protein
MQADLALYEDSLEVLTAAGSMLEAIYGAANRLH